MHGAYFYLLGFCIISLAATSDKKNIARYDNYRMYYVDVDTDEQVNLFRKLEERSDSYTFYGHARHPGQKLTIMVAAHKIAEITDLLNVFKVNHKILVYNFQEKIDEQWKTVKPKDTPGSNYDWDHYFHLETIYDWLEQLVNKYSFVSIVDMGLSTEGVPIKGLKIAKQDKNTGVFVESGIHAREWIAPATATYIINELLTSTDPEVQSYTNDYNWIIFPVTNPDGYKYTFESDRMWRKNRQIFETCRGVDLNRNYPFHWNDTGSSPDPCRYDYAGPSAASEKETQALINFFTQYNETFNFKTYIALHSFSQLIMFPYGYTPDRVENYDDLKLIGSKAAEAIWKTSERTYLSGSIYETIYPSSGGSKDWAHAVGNVPITFTFELRGPPNSTDLFILPADEIIPTGKETFAAFRAILDEAKKLGYYD